MSQEEIVNPWLEQSGFDAYQNSLMNPGTLPTDLLKGSTILRPNWHTGDEAPGKLVTMVILHRV